MRALDFPLEGQNSPWQAIFAIFCPLQFLISWFISILCHLAEAFNAAFCISCARFLCFFQFGLGIHVIDYDGGDVVSLLVYFIWTGLTGFFGLFFAFSVSG
jgi:hypothetical protein